MLGSFIEFSLWGLRASAATHTLTPHTLVVPDFERPKEAGSV